MAKDEAHATLGPPGGGNLGWPQVGEFEVAIGARSRTCGVSPLAPSACWRRLKFDPLERIVPTEN